MMDWSLIAAVNDTHVLNSTLLRSPDVESASRVVCKRGYPSAGLAYNDALDECHSDIAVLAHQDVYLPRGWIDRLSDLVDKVEACGKDWAVLGVVGVDLKGAGCGHVYSTGLGHAVGARQEEPVEAVSVDEMVIVLRTGAGLRFDRDLPGYHLYGTDISLQAAQAGYSTHVVSDFCIHNSNAVRQFPAAFWRAYRYVRTKWRDQLPVQTPCVVIQKSLWGATREFLDLTIRSWLNTTEPGMRVEDPGKLYGQLQDHPERAAAT